jgi:hypothetical protein
LRVMNAHCARYLPGMCETRNREEFIRESGISARSGR